MVAADGDAAWQIFEQDESIRVVISDWLMPGMDGQELCRRIRESSRATTYFLFMTSLEDNLHIGPEASSSSA